MLDALPHQQLTVRLAYAIPVDPERPASVSGKVDFRGNPAGQIAG